MMQFWVWLILAILTSIASCNTEKTIFVAPDAILLPEDASIDNLYLVPLNQVHPTVRTYINATFPAGENVKGTESWMLLQGLVPGQRYEVRICWLATQPTNFWLYTHTLSDAFEDPQLLSSLSKYASARHQELSPKQVQQLQARKDSAHRSSTNQSILFLHIFAAADYFTLNQSLMETVPPVLVDVILDPFLLNVFPQSLVPTAGYLVIIAVMAWFLSGWISGFLHEIAQSNFKTSAQPDPKVKKVQ